MQPNKLSHGYNLIWESSRMMLPEHREAIEKARHRKQHIIKPELDEQERSLIEDRIRAAHETNTPITLTVHHPSRLLSCTGIIRKIDPLTGSLILSDREDEEERIIFTDIMNAE